MEIISEEQRKKVLEEVGMHTIRQAIEHEGMLVSSASSITMDRHAATVWVKRRAHDFGVSAEVLESIVMGYLKQRAKEEIDKY